MTRQQALDAAVRKRITLEDMRYFDKNPETVPLFLGPTSWAMDSIRVEFRRIMEAG